MSSTPLQSPGDSGYFGSGQRRNKSNATVLISCSPIKETTNRNSPEHFPRIPELSPQIKFSKNLNFGNLTKNETISSIEINELSELELRSPNYSSPRELYSSTLSLQGDEQIADERLYDCYNRSTRHSFNSCSEDTDIKYKLFHLSGELSPNNIQNSTYLTNVEQYALQKNGKSSLINVSYVKQTKIDFIHELCARNCFSIISYILSFLSSKELCIASCICKEWKEVILHDPKANSRRKTVVEERFTFLNGPSKVFKNFNYRVFF